MAYLRLWLFAWMGIFYHDRKFIAIDSDPGYYLAPRPT